MICFTKFAFSFQFFADADDVDIWMRDTLRLVSSEDVGRDEASVQSLLKKHKVILQELSLCKSLSKDAADRSKFTLCQFVGT